MKIRQMSLKDKVALVAFSKNQQGNGLLFGKLNAAISVRLKQVFWSV